MYTNNNSSQPTGSGDQFGANNSDSLPTITTAADGREVVSARHLYRVLGFDLSNWTRWHKKNIVNNPYGREGEDWSPLVLSTNADNQKVTNPNPTADFALTVEFAERLCMSANTDEGERVRRWFQAKRDELRQIKAQKKAVLPMTAAEALVHQAELFLKTAQAVVEHERRISTVEEKVDYLYQNQRQAQAELIALPQPSEPLAELSHPDQVRRIVNQYASAKSMATQDVWRLLYSELYYRYKVSVNHMKQLAGESKIQTLIRNGHAEKLYTIALHILRVDQPQLAQA